MQQVPMIVGEVDHHDLVLVDEEVVGHVGSMLVDEDHHDLVQVDEVAFDQLKEIVEEEHLADREVLQQNHAGEALQMEVLLV